jgi:hypothetical protein
MSQIFYKKSSQPTIKPQKLQNFINNHFKQNFNWHSQAFTLKHFSSESINFIFISLPACQLIETSRNYFFFSRNEQQNCEIFMDKILLQDWIADDNYRY